MATYGEIRLRLKKLFPSVDLELLNGWIQDRYTEILDRLPWQRLSKSEPLPTVKDKSIYTLSGQGIVSAVIHPTLGPLDSMSQAELNEIDPGRTRTGTPFAWAPAMDDTSNPPSPQIELVGKPDSVINLTMVLDQEVSAPGATSTLILPWVRPAALIEGVTANAKRHLGDYAGAELAEREFEKLVSQMIERDCLRQPAGTMQMADRYVRHRLSRRTS